MGSGQVEFTIGFNDIGADADYNDAVLTFTVKRNSNEEVWLRREGGTIFVVSAGREGAR